MPAAMRWIAGDDGDGGCHDGKEYFVFGRIDDEHTK